MQMNNRAIALGLDGLMTDITSQRDKWRKFYGVQGDPFNTTKLINDESFWASMHAFADLPEILAKAASYEHIYILTERPSKLQYVTANWLKRNSVCYDEVIYSAIKRYDCRIRKIGCMLDVQLDELAWFGYDRIATEIWERKC